MASVSLRAVLAACAAWAMCFGMAAESMATDWWFFYPYSSADPNFNLHNVFTAQAVGVAGDSIVTSSPDGPTQDYYFGGGGSVSPVQTNFATLESQSGFIQTTMGQASSMNDFSISAAGLNIAIGHVTAASAGSSAGSGGRIQFVTNAIIPYSISHSYVDSGGTLDAPDDWHQEEHLIDLTAGSVLLERRIADRGFVSEYGSTTGLLPASHAFEFFYWDHTTATGYDSPAFGAGDVNLLLGSPPPGYVRPGGNSSGSAGGGSGTIGGVTGTFPIVDTGGMLTSQYLNPATPAELEDAIGASAAGQIDFSLAGTAPQLWKLGFDGVFVGAYPTVTLHYDPSLLGSTPESSLFIRHFQNGSWLDPLNQVVDPDADTITFITNSFSPFILGGAEAVPDPGVGDYNHNGVVDAADYVVWRKNDGTQVGYDIWRAHFGLSPGSGSSSAGASPSQAAVPEPATLVLLMFAAAVWCLRRRRPA